MSQDLRKTFFEAMEEIMDKDEKVYLITFDLGFSFCESLQKKFPNRFINAGCIERAGIGIAAGLARAGMKPYCYSNGIFLIGLGYEAVRDDICYNKTDVKLCATGANGFLGWTHNWGKGEEENALKSLAIKSFFPQNKEELKEALLTNGPAYIRL